MAHYATPLSQRLPRVLVSLAVGGALAGCSIWPQSWSLRSEPLPVQQTQEPAPLPASAASSSSACADCAAAAAAQASSVAVPAPVVTATPIAPAPDAAQPVPQVTKLEVAQAAPASPSPAAPAPSAPHALAHGFYVNVGVFAVAQNANTVRSKLDGTGFPIVADTVKSKDVKATRIRVGPFAKRTQAQAAAKKIHALKLDAVVVRH
jgi:cell division septation protein DedD